MTRRLAFIGGLVLALFRPDEVLQIDRRTLICASAVGILAAPFVAIAQERKHARVAFLGAESPSTSQHFLTAFRQGMQEHGYVEGQNITIEARWAEGRSERFPELIGELVRLKVNAIVTLSTPAALAAKNGTTTIPVVFIASDPLGSGLVGSLARPGENLTGLSLALGEEFSRKWLELRVALGAREHRPVSGFCHRGGSAEG